MDDTIHRYTILTKDGQQYGLFNPPAELNEIMRQPYVPGANEYQDAMYEIGRLLGARDPKEIHEVPGGTISFFTPAAVEKLYGVMEQVDQYCQDKGYLLHHVRSLRLDETVPPLYEDEVQVVYPRIGYFRELKAYIDKNILNRKIYKEAIMMETTLHTLGSNVKSDGKGGQEYWVKVSKEDYDRLSEEIRAAGREIIKVSKTEVKKFIQATPTAEIEDAFFEYRLKEPIGNLLDQVAEESAELAQAVIKFKRAAGLSAGTVADVNDAVSDILEEYADVVGCMEVLKRSLEANGYVAADGKFDDAVRRYVVYKRARALMRYYGYGREFITKEKGAKSDAGTDIAET
ncbi:hypothetical protein [uncultured Duncaniella sp.]|uniref:hypothetical protein n=1 Tax=uncultured Duncaniella sp. TaxID=2768039 RepID=UPI0026357216|nr:hypothetical protein [uncultured Duncaniella sp.]